eukprot:scaffold30457_cov73-Isochrysis_galbana.AAC.1
MAGRRAAQSETTGRPEIKLGFLCSRDLYETANGQRFAVVGVIPRAHGGARAVPDGAAGRTGLAAPRWTGGLRRQPRPRVDRGAATACAVAPAGRLAAIGPRGPADAGGGAACTAGRAQRRRPGHGPIHRPSGASSSRVRAAACAKPVARVGPTGQRTLDRVGQCSAGRVGGGRRRGAGRHLGRPGAEPGAQHRLLG